jgi:hypothetical protein
LLLPSYFDFDDSYSAFDVLFARITGFASVFTAIPAVSKPVNGLNTAGVAACSSFAPEKSLR